MQIPLHLRSWDLEDFVVVRSGLRWLCPDGHMCQPGETIAYCNIGFRPRRSTQVKPMPFKAEFRDLQIAISSPLSGVLRQNADISKGGFFDLHEGTFVWKDGFTIGNIEASAPGNYQNCAASCGLIMLAGRRMTEIAEIRSGLLTGWHDRSRAWTLSRPGKMGTLLSLGICEMDGVIRGEKSAFLEILGEAGVPMQVVFVPDTPLVPNSRVLAGQLSRTKPEFEAISRSLSGALATSDPLVSPDDWLFAGALLRQLGSCPIADEYELLTAGGLQQASSADALILSLSAELSLLMQHRELGYECGFHGYRLGGLSPAFKEIVKREFILVRRSIEEIREDYTKLIGLIRQRRPDALVLVYNCISSSGHDDLQCYASFDAPLNQHVSSVRNKDLNLMLGDLAREYDIAIIDADAIAADIGGRQHLSGVHQSGTMQTEIRRAITDILRSRGFPGFRAAD